MRQEAVSPCSWGPGDTGDQSPRQVLFSTEPPPPVSPPCDEGPTTSGTKLHSSSCLGSRVTPTLPVPVAHPLIMPVEPAAGCATAGTVGRRCLSRGMAVVLTPPQVSPPPRDPLLPAQPLVISVLLWVPACPPSFQCPDWGGSPERGLLSPDSGGSSEHFRLQSPSRVSSIQYGTGTKTEI